MKNNCNCELLPDSNRPCEILPEPTYGIEDGYIYRDGIKHSRIIEMETDTSIEGYTVKITSETLSDQTRMVIFIDETTYLKITKANEKRLNESLMEIKRKNRTTIIAIVFFVGYAIACGILVNELLSKI